MKRLVLLGGGHSHVEVLRRFAAAPRAGGQIVVVTPEPKMIYSGMLPGLVAGHYRRAECEIELAPLCRAAGIALHYGHANGIDPAARTVRLADGTALSYDLLSINIGAAARPPITGSIDQAVAVRPFERFLEAWRSIEAAATRGSALTIAVVGGGAGGVELALAIHHRLRTLQPSNAFKTRLHLLTDASCLMSDHGSRVQRKLQRVVQQRGIRIHFDSRIARFANRMLYRDGRPPLAVDYALFATGAEVPHWVNKTGLVGDPRGFLLVKRTLQSVSHPEVFAAGDIASFEDLNVPKSGVYAVREGPVLSENLRCALAGQPLQAYAPQPHALALIGTGNRRAVASWRGLAFEGNWIWRWKDGIDRRFVARYRI
jgi:selenide,water dikinase